MRLLTYRAFSTELLKIANDLGDADIRALLAERQGKEYLKGGELPTNGTVPPDRPVPAGDGGAIKIASYALAAPGLLRAHKKEEGAYQTVRDTGLKALGGAAGGAGAVKLINDMAGKAHSPHGIRMGAGIGAGLAIADKAFRHRAEIKNSVRRKPKVKQASGADNSSISQKRTLGFSHGPKMFNYSMYDHDPGIADSAYQRYQDMGLPAGSVTRTTDNQWKRPSHEVSVDLPYDEALKHPEFKEMAEREANRAPSKKHGKKLIRNLGVGAGVGIGLGALSAVMTKKAFVQQNANATFRSPADELASTQTVGKFQNKVHQSTAKVPGVLGRGLHSL